MSCQISHVHAAQRKCAETGGKEACVVWPARAKVLRYIVVSASRSRKKVSRNNAVQRVKCFEDSADNSNA